MGGITIARHPDLQPHWYQNRASKDGFVGRFFHNGRVHDVYIVNYWNTKIGLPAELQQQLFVVGGESYTRHYLYDIEDFGKIVVYMSDAKFRHAFEIFNELKEENAYETVRA